MIIMKFGGSSIKDAAAMEKAAAIVSKYIDKKPIVVLSALGGVTDKLIDALNFAAEQQIDEAQKIIDKLESRHQELVSSLFSDHHPTIQILHLVTQELEKVRVLLSATEAIRVKSKRISNAVLSVGEILSSNIFSELMCSKGYRSACPDARKFIKVTYHGVEPIPLPDEIETAVHQQLPAKFDEYQVLITQGFIATTEQGGPATLGRDGSDYTASLLGAALNCSEIQIWSDVDGILSADPTIIPSAKPLKTMTFDEACELAYFGARVLHPSTIQPALEKGIPVRVLNSTKPAEPGTLIVAGNDSDDQTIVKSIAYKENITLLTLESSRLLLSPKVMEEIFELMYRQGKRVYAVSKSATKVSVTIENNSGQQELIESLSRMGQVVVERDKVIVSVVGERMKGDHNLNWQIIRMLEEAGIKLDLISQFADQISLMFITNEKDIAKTVELLHQRLIEE